MTNKPNGRYHWIKFPPELIEECNTEIIKAYDKYGNSWIEKGFNTGFWIDRINEEFEELKKAENHWDRRKELLDIINVCRMMYFNEDGGVR
jgi:hypothetical protein